MICSECKLIVTIPKHRSTLQRPFKNLPPTGKAIPPPKIADSLYQSKAALTKQPPPTTTTAVNPTNGITQTNAQQSQLTQQPPSSPPLPPPPEQTQNLPAPSDYAVTEL